MSYMTNDPRSALNRLIAAFEAHLDAAATGDELSPAVVAAENTLQDAFFTYDDSLFTAYGIELPFEAFDSDSDDDDDEDYDDGEYDEDDEEDDYDEVSLRGGPRAWWGGPTASRLRSAQGIRVVRR